MAVVYSLNTKTHSSKEIAEFCFENADVRSICYCKQRMKSTLSLSSECVKTKFCKPCTSFTSHLHSSCKMVWNRTLRVKVYCMIPVWMTFTFSQGHRITVKLEVVQSLCCKATWSIPNVCCSLLCKGESLAGILNTDLLSICSSCFRFTIVCLIFKVGTVLYRLLPLFLLSCHCYGISENQNRLLYLLWHGCVMESPGSLNETGMYHSFMTCLFCLFFFSLMRVVGFGFN